MRVTGKNCDTDNSRAHSPSTCHQTRHFESASLFLIIRRCAAVVNQKAVNA